MTTPMHVYAEIASRYGVDPSNPVAVDEFFEGRFLELSETVRSKILAEILTAQSLLGR